MEEKNQRPLQQDGEMKIPVFTVLKNGAILKNIFIVNKSPDPESLASSVHDHDEGDGDVLIVGRHPDCNILLTHPSISRFHLQIQSNPSSQNLSVVDLFSGNLSSPEMFDSVVSSISISLLGFLDLDCFLAVGKCTGRGYRGRRLSLG